MGLDFVLGQALINGLVVGMLYLLMAVGFTVVFGVMRIVNFAHAEFYMVGAFVSYVCVTQLGLPFLASVVVAFVSVMIAGQAIEWLVLKPLRTDELSGMIATIGIGMILQSSALFIFGPDPRPMPPVAVGVTRLGNFIIPNSRLYVVVFSLAVLVLLFVFFKYSKYGRALRAVVQDTEAAAMQGIRSSLYYPMGFGLGVGLAAVAGALMAPVFSVSPFIGFGPMVKAFIVVILGGLGSIPGAALAGLLLGLTESLAGTFLKSSTADIVIFLLVIVVLVIRPYGLLGQKE